MLKTKNRGVADEVVHNHIFRFIPSSRNAPINVMPAGRGGGEAGHRVGI